MISTPISIVSSKQEEGDERQIAEDVAERYLTEFVERCMIQVRERDVATLKMRSFHMHDLMRDSMSSITFVLQYVFTGRGTGKDFAIDNVKAQITKEEELHEASYPITLFPSSLGNLRCLQTLDLRIIGKWSNSIRVPNVIWRMKKLRHLYLPNKCSRKTKLKLGTLRNLQTLVNSNTKNCYLKDLINMTNIRELEIRGAFNIEDFYTEELGKNPPIVQSRYLQSLPIINGEGRIDPRHLTHLLSSCNSIFKLSLDVEVSYLKMLELHEEAFIGKEMFCCGQAFANLESLSLKKLNNLDHVESG
ncbi:hypothetical protein Golob_018466 [Gossypium lobatum]|uniref:Uncharacterized protein n=1 Tax=Gossypium lobatum TaxID=34289 RepID=A0A7J8MAJ7_9ROSI|nr:hypothetical protein [Gossypium lobatum]